MSEQCRVITVEQWQDYLKLKERLAIATKALEDLELANDIRICMKAHGTLKEMGGVK